MIFKRSDVVSPQVITLINVGSHLKENNKEDVMANPKTQKGVCVCV